MSKRVAKDGLFLPIGQPRGLAAFAQPGRLLVSKRRFTGAEIGSPHGGPIDCVVSFDQTEALLHFCLAHRWGDLAAGLRDPFRTIATVLAHQAMRFAISDMAAVLQGDGLVQHRGLVRAANEMAGRMRFYRHSLPWRDLAERFCRVDMGWERMRFIDPDFAGTVYESLPDALRAAAERGEGGDSRFIARAIANE